jgi:hypothetical protein
MYLASEGMPVFRKARRDYAAILGVVAILLGLIVIAGITYTYMSRPALIEAVAKRVLDIRQLFEDTFR